MSGKSVFLAALIGASMLSACDREEGETAAAASLKAVAAPAAAATAPLTSPEQRELLRALKRFNYPAYRLGGCQERAHAAYRLAPDALRERLGKIWLISPVRGGAGGVRLPASDPNAPRYDFQVAVSFEDADRGTMVYDACLANDRFYTQAEWAAQIAAPGAPGPVKSAGEVYTFVPQGGRFVTYTADLHKQMVLPRALGRDAAVKRVTCARLRALLANPGALGEAYQRMLDKPEEGGDCAIDVQHYRVALESWDSVLAPSQIQYPESDERT